MNAAGTLMVPHAVRRVLAVIATLLVPEVLWMRFLIARFLRCISCWAAMVRGEFITDVAVEGPVPQAARPPGLPLRPRRRPLPRIATLAAKAPFNSREKPLLRQNRLVRRALGEDQWKPARSRPPGMVFDPVSA